METLTITSLNTWGGKMTSDFLAWVQKQVDNKVSIICMQEFYGPRNGDFSHGERLDSNPMSNQFQVVSRILKDYDFRFCARKDFDNGLDDCSRRYDPWGLVVFYRKDLKLVAYQEEFIGHDNFANLQGDDYIPLWIQKLTFSINGQNYDVFNYHGLWLPEFGKGDCPARTIQSQRLVEFLEKADGIKIVCGDFNLCLQSESIKHLEEETSLENMVRKFRILTGRTVHYPVEKFKKWPHASYIFLDKGVEVLKFFGDVLFAGSDHQPFTLVFRL